MKKTIILPIVFLICISMNSCISFKREIILNKDGSGSEMLVITFEKLFYEMISSMTAFMDPSRQQGFLDSLYNDEIFMQETRDKFDSIPGIKLLEFYSATNPDSSKSFTYKYEFDSVHKIGKSHSAVKAQDSELPDASIKFDDSDKDNITFTLDYKNKLYGDTESEFAESDSLTSQMMTGMAEMFQNGKIEIAITFPYDVVSSNADSSSGRTYFWNSSMQKLITDEEMMLNAVMKDN